MQTAKLIHPSELGPDYQYATLLASLYINEKKVASKSVHSFWRLSELCKRWAAAFMFDGNGVTVKLVPSETAIKPMSFTKLATDTEFKLDR